MGPKAEVAHQAAVDLAMDDSAGCRNPHRRGVQPRLDDLPGLRRTARRGEPPSRVIVTCPSRSVTALHWHPRADIGAAARVLARGMNTGSSLAPAR